MPKHVRTHTHTASRVPHTLSLPQRYQHFMTQILKKTPKTQVQFPVGMTKGPVVINPYMSNRLRRITLNILVNSGWEQWPWFFPSFHSFLPFASYSHPLTLSRVMLSLYLVITAGCIGPGYVCISRCYPTRGWGYITLKVNTHNSIHGAIQEHFAYTR